MGMILRPHGRVPVNANLGASGWATPGASLDLDFKNNRLFGAASFDAAVAISRASVGYAEDLLGNWTQFAANTRRVSPGRGMLCEEARTNSIRNNSMQGGTVGVIGSGGVMPNNWFVVNGAGLTTTIIEKSVRQGIDYLRLRVQGTTTNTLGISFRQEQSTFQAASPGQQWTTSAFASLVSGSIANITSIAIQCLERDSGGTLLSGTNTFIQSLINSTLARFAATRVMGASTAFVQSAVTFDVPIGATIDITIDIGWPQLELGAFMTSPIRTTTVAATRAADVPTIINPTLYAQIAQGGLFFEWEELLGPIGTNRALGMLRVDSNNYIMQQVGSANRAQFLVQAAAVNTVNLRPVNDVAAGNTYRSAGRWAPNDHAARYKGLGGQPANQPSGAIPTGAFDLRLGGSGGFNCLGGYLKRAVVHKNAPNDNRLNAWVA